MCGFCRCRNFNPTLGLILTIQPGYGEVAQGRFQSYLRSDSDLCRTAFQPSLSPYFNPTLGLILTMVLVVFLEGGEGFQSYLRSDSDEAYMDDGEAAQLLFQSYLRSDSDVLPPAVFKI